MASIDDFHAIEMKIGTILSAEFIEGADKLLKLSVDFGPLPVTAPTSTPTTVTEEGSASAELSLPATEEGREAPTVPTRDIRQILSGIREYYSPESLVGKQCPFVTNLAPRTMRGLESHGMILAVGLEGGGAVLLHPDKEVPRGAQLR